MLCYGVMLWWMLCYGECYVMVNVMLWWMLCYGENVMVALRIIIELYKTYRPQFTPEVKKKSKVKKFNMKERSWYI